LTKKRVASFLRVEVAERSATLMLQPGLSVAHASFTAHAAVCARARALARQTPSAEMYGGDVHKFRTALLKNTLDWLVTLEKVYASKSIVLEKQYVLYDALRCQLDRLKHGKTVCQPCGPALDVDLRLRVGASFEEELERLTTMGRRVKTAITLAEACIVEVREETEKMVAEIEAQTCAHSID